MSGKLRVNSEELKVKCVSFTLVIIAVNLDEKTVNHNVVADVYGGIGTKNTNLFFHRRHAGRFLWN